MLALNCICVGLFRALAVILFKKINKLKTKTIMLTWKVASVWTFSLNLLMSGCVLTWWPSLVLLSDWDYWKTGIMNWSCICTKASLYVAIFFLICVLLWLNMLFWYKKMQIYGLSNHYFCSKIFVKATRWVGRVMSLQGNFLWTLKGKSLIYEFYPVLNSTCSLG